jgi:hypothetical protein
MDTLIPSAREILREMKKTFRRLFLLGFFLLCVSARAAQLAVGDAVPAIVANDQHGTGFQFTNGVRFLLVATEMGCSKAANQKLAAAGAGFLDQHHAAYLVDIHTMPAVARVFALPTLRKYPHRIVLVETADALAAFPAQPGRVTVLALTPAKRIQKISYWNPAREPLAGFLE